MKTTISSKKIWKLFTFFGLELTFPPHLQWRASCWLSINRLIGCIIIKAAFIILFRCGYDGNCSPDELFFDEHTDLGDMTAEPTLDCVDQIESVDEDEELYSHETDGLSSGDESDESTQLPDSVTYSLRIPDPLCMKLDDLISRGLLSSDGILYKHVHDVVECIYNPLHKYHPDVVEFFNTVQHLGGQATVNFLRGRMSTCSGSSIKRRNVADCRMNFGGPCIKTLHKKTKWVENKVSNHQRVMACTL